ncbi:hypothetical protein CAPTEDRAFT_192533 [Capitella teleta]|uniref:Endoplasmic reticulum-Golgi intermediate compartment protein 3 n=1 Tax=Capitella teleta TaxID=283909 RepID=R7VEA9_CAPTE|nr:hypothetical protein CAPTEDRAFT_192533 [Capitella teleta]|eukprot:ELU16969.1 hypothetical protein CAPTEDRAFT_192533 [Capitella teleta]
MFVLFVSEFNYYLTTEVHPELFVDTARGQKLKINVDMTFPTVGCSFLTLDAMDVSGEQQIDVLHDIFKQRLDLDGIEVKAEPSKEGQSSESCALNHALSSFLFSRFSCYGAESEAHKCCNTCNEVREAYRQKGWAFVDAQNIEQCMREGYVSQLEEGKNEGCRIYGFLEVNKVAGNFHVAPGRSFSQHHAHIHDMQALQGMKFNMSHRIQHLSFGDDYPGQVNPLDASEQVTEQADFVMFSYYVKVVPTSYLRANGEFVSSNQYSVTKHHKKVGGGILGEQGLPGVFVTYELSPMMVKYTEKNR